MALRMRSRLPEWFKKTGKKQVDLARHLKVSEAFISQVCNNKEKLTVVQMKMTADFFDCYMDDLAEWIYEPD
ncbi:helix-turn-helix transcriptional regulator [Paenibacillus sp. HJGM_3]|uniref:helix-turn-helix transcriptional regulator n=1 Tax=Paenibacillus sp. HJGM_3 TaxID=3379816 RepID=UPI00385BB45A